MSTKKRGKKTSLEQMEAIINFINCNNIIISGKCHPMRTDELESKWKELVEVLNNLNGARKDLKQWKSFFAEWKSKVRKKAREHKTSLVQTGGGGFINKELSDIENRLMRVIGWISITGCAMLPDEIDPDAPEEIHPNAFDVNPLTSTLPNNDVDLNELLKMPIIEYIVEENGDDQSPVQELIVNNQNEDSKPLDHEVIGKKTKVTKTKGHSIEGTSRSSKLENSAKMYADSSNNLSAAINNLADGLNNVAKAILTFSEVLSTKKN
ncbi:hypothetical protein RN001_008516 [Aquatica leii]|uniref:Regulatory protein zeste n=1 Tax=Aquatica leii TaxID=1421715 RepID=A0AAN7Q574_9COLE|nr:hypothetical protein RN001_008516 [Aquatica leii]